MKLLGIDVGTGGTRVLLLDQLGHVLSSATAEHAPPISLHIGWAEQSPEDWWNAACRAIPECLAKGNTSGDQISGIGLTGQMHGLVLLGAKGEVLRPSIIWCDQRTGEQCRAVTQKIGARRLIQLTANPALTGFTLPKILWVQQHEPEIWERARGILLPKDYLRFRLTGIKATDVADASGTLLFDVSKRKWSADMLDVSGIVLALLPRVFERAPRWLPARETRPRAQWAWGSYAPARLAPPSARLAWFSRPPALQYSNRRGAFTRFVTPFPIAGMSWVLRRERDFHCGGSAINSRPVRNMLATPMAGSWMTPRRLLLARTVYCGPPILWASAPRILIPMRVAHWWALPRSIPVAM